MDKKDSLEGKDHKLSRKAYALPADNSSVSSWHAQVMVLKGQRCERLHVRVDSIGSLD